MQIIRRNEKEKKNVMLAKLFRQYNITQWHPDGWTRFYFSPKFDVCIKKFNWNNRALVHVYYTIENIRRSLMLENFYIHDLNIYLPRTTFNFPKSPFPAAMNLTVKFCRMNSMISRERTFLFNQHFVSRLFPQIVQKQGNIFICISSFSLRVLDNVI